MYSYALASLLLPALSLAAPTKQHPLGVRHNPYAPSHRDPYDRKVDSIGEDLYPEPYVSRPVNGQPL